MMESKVGEASSRPVEIVPAGWRDLNALRQLEKECFPKDAWPLWDLIGILTLPGVVRLKAVADEQMIGFIGADIRQSEGLAWIATIGVLPAFRRQGIGGSLLEACETQLHTARIRLTVRSSNQAAIQLYETYGYRKIGVWPDYYQDREDGLVMEKRR